MEEHKLVKPFPIVDPDPERQSRRQKRASEPKGSRKKSCHSFSNYRMTESLMDIGLTIVHPFYNEKARFEIQFWNWKNYDEFVKRHLRILLVDDCSNPPVSTYLVPSKAKRIDFNLIGYRITKDLKWNTPGALNLGIMQAPTDWVLIMDSDCLLSPEMISQLMTMKPNEEWFYYFPRNRITNERGKIDRYLPCSVLFHKESFMVIGGFDEDFTGERSGGYGIFDNDFEFRIGAYGYELGLVKDIIIDEYLEDMVGPNIQMKTGVTADGHIRTNKKLFYDKINGIRDWNRNILNFPWEKSFEYERW